MIEQELSEGWQWVKIADVCDRIDYGFTASADFTIQEPHFLRITDIQNGQVNWENAPGCEITPAEEQKNLLVDGDIVIARTGGTVGKSFLIVDPPRAVFASYLIRLQPSSDVLPKYLYLFLQSDNYWDQIRQSARGGAQPNVNATLLGLITLPLPPLSEQQHIVAIIEEQMVDIDAARIAVEAEVEAAEALTASYLREVFESEKAGEWECVPLGDLGEVRSGITLGRKLAEDVPVYSVPYLRVANVKDGYLDLSDVKEIEASEDEIARYHLQYGDILLTEGGDPDKLGRGTFWQEQILNCIHQNHIFRVRFDLDKFLPQFLSAQIGSSYGKKYFLAHAKQTTGIATINQAVLKRFPLLVPSLIEQQHILEMLEQKMAEVDKIHAELEQQLEAANAMPAAVLRRAFNGEL